MSVEVKLELGHKAVQRDKLTAEGFTHDWTVFVRGAEGHNINYFVEKVVFHLHESFPKPKRVLKEPPYLVSESGYAGFIMPIDVYFRTREEPRKVTFKYDLYLRLQGPPVSNIRVEKLTFQNPSADFRGKLLKAGGLAGALTGSAAGGSASLSTQACAPPPSADEVFPSNPTPKQAVAEKKPRTPIASKEIPNKPAPALTPPPPKASQPFTDIFGAPIRTKSSPDASSVKSKDSGHSSQTKNKPTSNSSSSSVKEGKSSSKEKDSHKTKESYIKKELLSPTKETHSSKEAHVVKDSHISKDVDHSIKDLPPKDTHTAIPKETTKETPHPTKEKHSLQKGSHSKESHKGKDKDGHHSSKEKTPKESRPPEPKDSKPPKLIKSDKESTKPSAAKKTVIPDSLSSHGNGEKKKKPPLLPPESSEKSSSSHPKHKVKIKESKNKDKANKTNSHSTSVKKEEEKTPKHNKPSPARPIPPEPIKPKSNSPFKAPSPVVMKPPSPTLPLKLKPPSPPPIVAKSSSPVTKDKNPPSPHLPNMDSDIDTNTCNKATYSSSASSISESSLHDSNPFTEFSDHSIVSPLSNEDTDFLPSVPKRKRSIDSESDDNSSEMKVIENKPMPKLKKKHHSSSPHKSPYQSKTSDNHQQANDNLNSEISPSPIAPAEKSINKESNHHKNPYREELLKMQKVIMSLQDRKVLQHIVDLIEKTGKYEVTSTTFDFDLCSLDQAIIQKIKQYLLSYDKYMTAAV